MGIYKQHLGGLHEGYLRRYEQILNFNGIECIWLEASRRDFWKEVSGLDLFIYQWEHYDRPKQTAQAIIPVIEYEMKISCFPNWRSSWHYDDKIKQYYLLKQYGFPIIESYVFWEKNEALKWLEMAEMPVVFKLRGGAASNNVVLVSSKLNARRLISRMFGRGIRSGHIFDKGSLHLKYIRPYRRIRRFGGDILRRVRGEHEPLFWQIDKNYVLFQKFLPNNLFDTRVSVIGDRAFVFRRFNRENDFRASGSGRIDYRVNEINLQTVEIGFAISKRLNFQSMAYDFLMNEQKQFEVSEISYTYVDKAVFDCPGYFDSQLRWHEGHYWPQYCQLMDALKMVDLKQPDMKL